MDTFAAKNGNARQTHSRARTNLVGNDRLPLLEVFNASVTVKHKRNDAQVGASQIDGEELHQPTKPNSTATRGFRGRTMHSCESDVLIPVPPPCQWTDW
jgi:hypothetical protein